VTAVSTRILPSPSSAIPSGVGHISGSFTSTYRSFDPETQPAENLTTIDLEIRAEANEADAYPEYQALFADDLLDVLIVVGGDYNEQRYDMQAARAIFDELVDTVGLDPPVEGFDELVTSSGPFVGTLDSNGRSIRLEVTLIHPDMQAEEGVGYEGLKQIFRDGMAGLGINKMSVASKTTVGGYGDTGSDEGQFDVNDNRNVTTFCEMLRQHELEPVFKNWDQAYR